MARNSYTGPIFPAYGGGSGAEQKEIVVSLLSVEDNEADFVLLREFLNESPVDEHRFDLSHATTLADAIGLLESSESFDVIFLDLSLPDAHGKETYDRLAERAHGIPIIVLSGDTDRKFAIEIIQSGAQDFLIKEQLVPEILTRAIFYAIERKRSFNETERLKEQYAEVNDDLKNAQMQLIQAEKLESLGRLAAGVAHEVRNPLGAIRMGIAYLQQRQEELGDEGFDIACAEMDTAIDRADKIIQGMVDYSREDSISLTSFSPNKLVNESIKFVQYELNRSNATVHLDLSENVPDVLIDVTRMEQVIINLINNSLQAMAENSPEPGVEPSITITTDFGKIEEIHRDEGLRDYGRLRREDKVVVITLRDTGPGIPPEKIHRIFEPFFTTKPTGEGTGLGLSVVERIIGLHRGHIEVENATDPVGLITTIILKAAS